MWRPSLTTRFFLALAALAIALIILPGLAIRWSVQHEIIDYVQRREFARLQPLQEALIDAYQRHGNWQFLQQEGSDLEALIQQTGVTDKYRRRWLMPPPEPGRGQRADHGPGPDSGPGPGFEPRPEPGMMEPPPLHERLQVLNSDQQLVTGQAPPAHFHTMRQPLLWQGETIGYLQLQIPPFVRDGLEQRFLSGQLNTLLFISGAAILLALAVAWWLGRGLVKPILSVAGTVRQLAEGQLDARTVISRADELGQLARDVDRLAETLTANERLRREVMADVSHEFRTPLALLQGKIEAMQDGVLPSDSKTLATLHDATLRLSRMVDDLYQVALADTGALRLHCQDFNLRELVEQAVQEADAKWQAAGLRCQVDGETHLQCHADRQRLRQVLDNLLHNSARYTDAGGEVRVHLQRDGEWAQLIVEDSAPGVPSEAQSQLFDRFFRVEGSRSRDAGGSGLGLSVVKAIVQAHAGSVTAAHSTLGGLAIVIRLPLTAAARSAS